ncbi:EspA/EspE family type VII secretion system effector [Mycobacterium kansasii]|nr:EspA/EspE family type VII secretion system effector [Mycobacterium kansasii]ARG59730.1 hypothetical protein B1T43_21525 [Mycobacterium kansasii]ARG65193.1 hypothetical protein B1T45_22025 [Mycobacterium kansasii]ARG72944.1 hypothetical protein B1T47_21335 [Mycobacterium kansasii]ARG78053.1 hypothetical protein B1T51_07345 [Mycobacterium kansasii]ARG83501.1 hypothetical protein B1T52_07220 [Mycobacterium kansasii]
MFLQEFRNRQDVRRFVQAHAGSGLCVGTELLLGTVLLGLGVKTPDTGDRFVASRAIFDDVSAQIAALVPDGGWQGSAAQAYLAQNLAQSQRAKLMGDLDHLSGDLVSAQAETIQNARTVVFLIMVFVGFLLVICVTAELNGGPAGQILSYQLALKGCTLALSAVDACLVWLMITTSRNTRNLQILAQELTDTMTRLPTLSDPVPGSPDVSFHPGHSPSDVETADHTVPATIPGPPDDNAPTAETPDVASAFAHLPGSPEFSMPDLPTPGFPDLGTPYLRVPQLAGMPSLGDLFCSPDGMHGLDLANPTTTSQPTMAPLTARLSQLTGLSGAASGLSRLANTAGQQAQMISSLAGQGAQQHATLAGHATRDDDTVVAAADTTTAGRAPVDTATGSSQARPQRVP